MRATPLPVAEVRIARPTDRLEEVVRFYRDGLGFEVIGGFEGHAGYDGVFLALPGRRDHLAFTYRHDGAPSPRDHLEFTRHRGGSPGEAPSPDHLLVLYIEDERAIRAAAARLAAMGYPEVEPMNPYWCGRAVTVADPDGWRVVLALPRGSAPALA